MSLSFIKLDINIMNDTKIKLIRKMPDGAKMFELWIGILCLAMKSGRSGVLEIGDGIPFNDETLAIELDIDLPVIRMGLEIFKKFKMIEYFENEEIYLVNFEKHQQLGKIERNNQLNRERVARHREKTKHVMITAPLRNDELMHQTKTRDKDLDKDKKDRLKPYLPLSELLYYEHKKVDSKYLRGKVVSDVLKNWANDIRLLVERDGRTIEEVEQVIKWVKTEGNFWFVNIMSGKKLRLQFPKLLLQMKQEGKKPGGFKGTDKELHSYDEFFGGSK